MEVNDNVLSLLKQAFYFSLNSVNDAIAPHGVTTAQIGLMRYLANEPGLSGAELARRLLITPGAFGRPTWPTRDARWPQW